MSQSEKTDARRSPVLQSILDLVVSCAVVLTSVAVVWNIVASRPSASPSPTVNQAPGPTQVRRPGPAIPAEPLSLAGAHIEGKKEAAIAIVEYSDFQCPFCGTFARETLPELKEKYVRSGKVLLAFRNLPLSIHQFATKAAEAAECAGQQGKFWQLHDVLFHQQNRLEAADLKNAAQGVGLDGDQFGKCLAGAATAAVQSDSASASSLGISGTPSFLVGTVQKDGRVKVARVLVGAQTLPQFDAVVAELSAPKEARR